MGLRMRMTKIVTAHATNCDRMRLPVVHANPERMRVLKVIAIRLSIYGPMLRLRREKHCERSQKY